MDGQSKTSLPDRADGEGGDVSGSRGGSSGDEQALESAVEGKETGGDAEMGMIRVAGRWYGWRRVGGPCPGQIC